MRIARRATQRVIKHTPCLLLQSAGADRPNPTRNVRAPISAPRYIGRPTDVYKASGFHHSAYLLCVLDISTRHGNQVKPCAVEGQLANYRQSESNKTCRTVKLKQEPTNAPRPRAVWYRMVTARVIVLHWAPSMHEVLVL
jgi:hypothetical protein